MVSNANEVIVHKVITAMEAVYGPFSSLTPSQALAWSPPPASAGQRGRYLWTDAFGVLNLITLYHTTSSETYLHCASRLIEIVHDTLGRTRLLDSYLPGASAEHPLAGGLRIGKEDETGPDGDGQYHHYLTLWAFALNRMSIVSSDKRYNDLAIELARAIHPAFMINRDSPRPRMFWKVSMDLSHPLVSSEGNLDPIDGYVVFSLLQKTCGDPTVLKTEIEEYRRILEAKWGNYRSDDPLDLGMTLWTAHWFEGREKWADGLMKRSLRYLRELAFEDRYFEFALTRRLAFREYGACLGIHSASVTPTGEDTRLSSVAYDIVVGWENAGILSSDSGANTRLQKRGLEPITQVMYAAAILPGAFRRGFLGEETV